MKFSIIVPAYNIESYLDQCIQSVISQTYPDYELLVIDDGSSDQSYAVAKAYTDKNERVKVFSKPNGGLSDARNFGIERATGDYILFLDGDDFWTDAAFLEKVSNEISKNSVDLLIYGYSKYYETETIPSWNDYKQASSDFGKDVSQLISKGIYGAPAWNKCIRRTVFDKGLEFKVGILSEDAQFCYDLMDHVQTYSILNSYQCMYRQNRSGSITNIVKEKNVLDNLEIVDRGLNETSGKTLNTEINELYFTKSYISILPFLYFYLDNERINQLSRKYHYLLKDSLKISPLSFKLTGLISRLFGLRLSTWFYSKILKFYKRIVR